MIGIMVSQLSDFEWEEGNFKKTSSSHSGNVTCSDFYLTDQNFFQLTQLNFGLTEQLFHLIQKNLDLTQNFGNY